MSQTLCTESECIDKILKDYNEHVFSKEDYYYWANQKYQSLMNLLKNPKNAQIFYKALNFVTYLNPQTHVDINPKNEKMWNQFRNWDKDELKNVLIREFDSEAKEKKRFEQKNIGGRIDDRNRT